MCESTVYFFRICIQKFQLLFIWPSMILDFGFLCLFNSNIWWETFKDYVFMPILYLWIFQGTIGANFDWIMNIRKKIDHFQTRRKSKNYILDGTYYNYWNQHSLRLLFLLVYELHPSGLSFWLPIQILQQSWVQFQHPPRQRNQRDERWSSVE